VLFFVGRERFGREFELYFREDAGRGIAPAATLFRGNLVQYLLHRARLVQDAREADLVAHELFPGAVACADGHLHYPRLEGSLRVERSIDRQIGRMCSRAQRRRARGLLRRGGYRAWVEYGPKAPEKFRTMLYEPYVRARFGAWGFVNDPAELRRLYARKACILFVASSARPSDPVCGALLLDEGPGVVACFLNGFSDTRRGDPARIAEDAMALELAVMKHAIKRRLLRINLGYTRAILSDGVFTWPYGLRDRVSPITEAFPDAVPLGGRQSDIPQIQNAMHNCQPQEQVISAIITRRRCHQPNQDGLAPAFF
jgi:hypothetical protein